MTPKPAPKRNWAYGISRNSGLICNQKIQIDRQPCADFEIRFCCPKNLKQNASVIEFLSYSESDFGEGKLTIRLKL